MSNHDSTGAGMKVSELIDCLSALPQDAEVWTVWDGGARGVAMSVYLSRGGKVLIADEDECVYSDEDRPLDAPTEAENRYWRTPRVTPERW